MCLTSAPWPERMYRNAGSSYRFRIAGASPSLRDEAIRRWLEIESSNDPPVRKITMGTALLFGQNIGLPKKSCRAISEGNFSHTFWAKPPGRALHEICTGTNPAQKVEGLHKNNFWSEPTIKSHI